MAELKTRLTMDSSGFKVGMDEAKTTAGGFEQAMSSLKGKMAAALSVGSVVAFAKSVMDLGGKIQDLSTQAGVSTAEFQGLSSVARESGVEDEQLAQSLAKLREAQGQAINGSSDMRKKFEDLGVSFESLQTMSPAELFEAVAKAAASGVVDSAALNDVMDVMGAKSAPRLQEALQRVAKDGLGAIIDEARKTGQVMSDEVISKLDEAGDYAEKLKRALQVGGGTAFGWIAEKIDVASSYYGTLLGGGSANQAASAMYSPERDRAKAKVEAAQRAKDVQEAQQKAAKEATASQASKLDEEFNKKKEAADVAAMDSRQKLVHYGEQMVELANAESKAKAAGDIIAEKTARNRLQDMQALYDAAQKSYDLDQSKDQDAKDREEAKQKAKQAALSDKLEEAKLNYKADLSPAYDMARIGGFMSESFAPNYLGARKAEDLQETANQILRDIRDNTREGGLQ